ncbi:hypothetical protein C8A05DRAFT_47235 [Staphylotrichum tortipilum]|uniref:Uncharacterized protein n=1 Tax=Staphylotrichum tortipilum TaxID=2831512 RepID=A0AAN6ME27_9PEZI|nr:hypothetical protein C8A05DRAFT_47235 [Staphylotrichum longicolle]
MPPSTPRPPPSSTQPTPSSCTTRTLPQSQVPRRRAVPYTPSTPSPCRPCEHGDAGELAAACSVVQEWQSVACVLSQATPGRLVLSLVCDINPQHPRAMDLARDILLPILLLPPAHLKHCNMRLAKTVDRRLQQLAEDTAAYACGLSMPKSPQNPTTTLASLPRELRIRILEHTDLITPRRQVLWSPQDRAYSVYVYQSGEGAREDDRYSDQFSECWRDKTDYGGPPTNGCYCRCRHAAFSAACTCWAAPGPALFLICRVLYEDALFVFFSGNRFVVYDYEPSPPWKIPIPEQYREDNRPTHPMPTHPFHAERFAISEFLREVVPRRSLRHIRFLELLFPPYRPPLCWPESDHPAFQDWQATVDWLKDKANLPGLTIRLVVVPQGRVFPRSVYRPITLDEVETVMTAYSDLLQPLRQLATHGLARFYAHFPSPLEWTLEGRERAVTGWRDWTPRQREALKKRAESEVMGSRYESLCDSGIEEPRTSDWEVLFYTND